MALSGPGQSGWGRLDFGPQRALRLEHRLGSLPDWEGSHSILPFGNGRSYGDSCLNTGGALIECGRLDRFISFDRDTGVMRCEAGILLSQALELGLPDGWILPVLPGTQFVTVGGAVANDVHGKNHHRAGTFGSHVICFELLRSDGRRLHCSSEENSELFGATIGGLGLTGVITWVEFKLKPVATPYLQREVIRFKNLSEFFQLSGASDDEYEYTVAWVDCLAKGPALGRGLFVRANHLDKPPAKPPTPPRRTARIPFSPPLSLINAASLRLFNFAYYRKQLNDRVSSPVHYKPFFFPLDSIREWNRIYGPRGFYQYQCVLPMAQGEAGISEILQKISLSGTGSFLAVLKIFGDIRSPGIMSFPRPGVTLALDFPNKGKTTMALLASLDAITHEHGGALYPAKDARMPPWLFEKSFPALNDFKPHIDPAFSSSFWRRVTETSVKETGQCKTL